MGLSVIVIRVLSEDDGAHLVERCGIESVEPLAALGKDLLSRLALLNEEFAQLGHIGRIELRLQDLEPARVELDGRAHAAASFVLLVASAGTPSPRTRQMA